MHTVTLINASGYAVDIADCATNREALALADAWARDYPGHAVDIYSRDAEWEREQAHVRYAESGGHKYN